MRLKKLHVFLLLLALLAVVSALAVFHGLDTPRAQAASDTVTITDKTGSGLTNYPLQFGRPFIQGEIPNYPQVLIDGTPALTQADVKNRYPDGSVKFAIISVVIPSVAASGSVTLTFRDQASGNNTPLTAAQMLSSGYDFDAQMKLTSGTTLTADARQMLSDGSYTYWTSGPVATTILLADDSAARKYDLGWDSYRSFRPRFYATFWPATHQVQVRYVGENINSTTLENLNYDLSLTLGNASPATVYTQSAVDHSYLTRWTELFWEGSTPPQKVNIDYNVGYLAATHYFPNYDTTYTPSDTVINNLYTAWTKSAHAKINDNGGWVKGMGTTGDRPDLGLQTLWNTEWTYTGDWRNRAMSLNLADLASAGWPMEIREGDPSAKIDRGQTVSGLGLPYSPYAHPGQWIPSNFTGYSPPALATAGNPSASARGWGPDGAHQPDPFYAPYILTGDYFYLENLQFWAAKGAFMDCPGTNEWCKGPIGTQGIRDQVRGDAWLFRTRTNAAFATPDYQTGVRTFFNQMIDDAVALWEGKLGITDGHFVGTAGYNWGKGGGPGLHFWDSPLHYFGCYPTTAGGGCSVAEWMQGYLMMALGWATERGFPSDKVTSWLAYNYTSRFAAPGYNPFGILGVYYVHVKAATGIYFPTWGDVMNNTGTVIPTATNLSGFVNDYPTIFAGASSYAASEPGGSTMWNWVDTNIRQVNYKNYFHGSDQRWNVIPRTGPNATPLPPQPGPVTPPVTPPTAAPTVDLVAAPTDVSGGDPVQITWVSTNATSCIKSGFSGSGTAGTVFDNPTATVTYGITCTGPGGSASDTAVVTVEAPGTPPGPPGTTPPPSTTPPTTYVPPPPPPAAIVFPQGSAVHDVKITGEFTTTDTCGTMTHFGDTCRIVVTFAPTSPGYKTGTLTYGDLSLGDDRTISTQVYGQAVAGVTATLDNQGLAAAGTSSAAMTIIHSLGNGIREILSAIGGFFSRIALLFTGSSQTAAILGSDLTITFPAQKVGASGLPQIVTLVFTGYGVQANSVATEFGTPPTGTPAPMTPAPAATSTTTTTPSSSTGTTTTATTERLETAAQVNVRTGAGTTNSVLCRQGAGTSGTVVQGPITAGPYTWYQVNYDSGCDGWSASNYLVTPGTAVATPSTPSAPSTVSSGLSLGSTGSAVIALQQALARNGYFKGAITGYYGPLTQGAVRAFQATHGIEVVGNVGPQTRAALGI